MRLISLEVLIQAVKEHGIDQVYTVLEKVFLTEPITVINNDGQAVFTPYEEQEIWEFLENLQNQNKEVEL